MACLLATFPTGPASAQVIGDSVPLANGDFESGETGWTLSKTPVSPVTTEAAHGGKLGLRVTEPGNGPGFSAFNGPFPVVAGKGYKLSFWSRSSADADGVYLRFFDDGHENIPEYRPGVTIHQSTDWSQNVILARAPATAAWARIWVRIPGKAPVTVDLDDFAVANASGPDIDALVVPVPAPRVPAPPPHPRAKPPYIVLKLDDLVHTGGKKVPVAWIRVADYLRGRNIQCAMGIICDSLEDDAPEFTDWIKAQHDGGLIEFWNHGFDHKEWVENGVTVQEFKGSGYDLQRDHFAHAQALAVQKLGFPLTTFGAPFNATDDSTVKVLEDTPEITVWLYGDTGHPAGKLVMDRVGDVNIENPLFVPSLARFIEGYNRYPDREYFVIQGHAAQWDAARFDQFTKIVDFLVSQKAIFITPSEFAALKKAGKD